MYCLIKNFPVEGPTNDCFLTGSCFESQVLLFYILLCVLKVQMIIEDTCLELWAEPT